MSERMRALLCLALILCGCTPAPVQEIHLSINGESADGALITVIACEPTAPLPLPAKPAKTNTLILPVPMPLFLPATAEALP